MFIDKLKTFRFETRISLIISSIAIIATLVLGAWSYFEIRGTIQQQIYKFMEVELRNVVENDLAYRSNLLAQSQMDSIPFFVKEYQREAINVLKNTSEEREGLFHIVDEHDDTIVDSKLAALVSYKNSPLKKDLSTSEGGGKIKRGTILNEGNQHLYIATYFPEWRWRVVYLLDDEVLQESVFFVFFRLIATISMVMLLTVILIILLLKRYIFSRVEVLKDAAVEISKSRNIEKIRIFSEDEFGKLARSLEGMALEIDVYEKRQATLQEQTARLNIDLLETNRQLEEVNQEIEKRVQARTSSLEKLQKELYDNLEQIKSELENTKEKNNILVKKLSELTLKQSDMIYSHSEIIKNLRSQKRLSESG